MGLFATEFPVAPSVTKAKFLATAVGWARGMTSSSLKIDEKSFQNYGDEIVFKGDGGEIFFIKELATSDGFVIGARHDLVDAGSRNWRTECVLTNRGSSASLRVRGQCLTGNYEVVPVIPKKPFFIKACLEDGWGANGGIFNVTDSPIFLTSQIDIAAKIAMGGYESTLPTIYLSTQDNGSTLLDPKKLAYDLGGIAHILVEPNRDFSFRLRDECHRLNPYGGTIGFSAAGVGVYRRFYMGGLFPDSKSLEAAVRSFAVSQVSKRSSMLGWEWQELQEEYSKRLRQARTRTSAIKQSSYDGEYIELLELELLSKEESILNLKQQIQSLTEIDQAIQFGDGIIQEELIGQLGAELYFGEFSDRVRAVLNLALKNESFGLDERTKELIRRVISCTEYSGRGAALIIELKNAGNQSDKAVATFIEILRRLGFELSQAGKHYKLTPRSDLFGVGSITIPKTPSEQRGLKNQASQIVSTLGLTTIKRA